MRIFVKILLVVVTLYMLIAAYAPLRQKRWKKAFRTLFELALMDALMIQYLLSPDGQL